MRRKALFAAAALVALSAGGFTGWRQYREKQQAAESARKAAEEAARRAAQTYAAGNVLSLSGILSATEVVNVPAPVDGTVSAFHAEVGDEVYEGQLLADITNTSLASAQEMTAMELEKAQERVNNLESALAAARLEASRAHADYSRVKGEFDQASRAWSRQQMLLREGATPRQQAEKAEAEYKSLLADSGSLEEVAKRADARLSALVADLDNARKALEAKSEDAEAAKARVDAGHVFALAGGVIASRRGAAGDEVHPTMDDLFRIATDLSKMTLTVEPPPSALSHLQPGLEVGVIVADLPNEILAGRIRSAENGRVLIDFQNPSPLVKPGHTAQARITIP